MSIFKIAFLLDKSNNWLEKDTKKFVYLYRGKKSFYKIFYDYRKIKNFDIVIVLGNTKIIADDLLRKNKLNVTIHESNLPKNRGFSPIQYQILSNKNLIKFCLIELVKKVDAGDILCEINLKLNGDELYDEIRNLQSKTTFKLINKFLKKYPNFKRKKQKGKSNFLKKRNTNDSKLDISKSIKENFNLLRINNNKDWPTFFNYKGKRYVLKIYKK